ncbi:hypothetical protein QJS10_CPB18g01473 [Acorus calamus]|uniref:Uncharacterized protein n=1 Tax=Acorus calamus TaxID=4465 RepID=A0AAV9CN86_ACOCL|nr:hypothetical protein QJS10_CPB18g01473 [Acorus calamus]
MSSCRLVRKAILLEKILKTWQLYEEGRLHELVDSDLGEYPEEVLRPYGYRWRLDRHKVKWFSDFWCIVVDEL